MPSCLNLSSCIFLALSTRFFIISDFSAQDSSVNSLYLRGGTSMCRSMRSSNGPEILDRYFCIFGGVQWHSFFGSVRKPHGQACDTE